MERPLRRLRVLQVLPALDHGGAENVAEALATGADRARFEMMVCCTRGLGPIAERIRQAGIQTVLAGPHERPNPYAALWYLHRTLRRLAPDVVHTHGVTSLADVGSIAFLRRVPSWVHTFHYGNYPYKQRSHMRLERIMATRPDQLVAVAEAQKAALVRFHHLDPRRVVTILNGVRANPFVDSPDHRQRKRAELGIAADEFVVGAVAVLSEQKGITHLLHAIQILAARGLPLRFVIAGGGPLEQALRAEATALGIDDHVRFLGWRNDAIELLPAFDVWVMSSLWEAMPLALLEAMAARRPIVVTDVSDNRQIVGDGAAGLLVPPAAPQALAEAVQTLFEDAALRRRLAQTASDRYGQNYALSHLVTNYQDLYSRLAGPSGSIGS